MIVGVYQLDFRYKINYWESIPAQSINRIKPEISYFTIYFFSALYFLCSSKNANCFVDLTEVFEEL